jgi:hypothetical protein
MQIIKKYPYKRHNRFQSETGRKYLVEDKPVPSVTTILSATEDKRFLDNWRRKIGAENADRITNESAKRGTEMHRVLEFYYQGQKYYNATDEGAHPRAMAELIKSNLNIEEVWGSEISLSYNYEYAGTTDLVAVSAGKPSIVDFKQSNRPKIEKWIDGYKHQLGAYYLAHKTHYGPIEQGIISIATKDLQYQQFVLNENNLKEYSEKFLQRVELYKEMMKKG